MDSLRSSFLILVSARFRSPSTDTNLTFDLSDRVGEKKMTNPILVTGAAGRVGAVGRTVTEQLLKEGKAVRAMVRKGGWCGSRIAPDPTVARTPMLNGVSSVKDSANSITAGTPTPSSYSIRSIH
jgi:NADPH:quinone reductase-like Zn-dependent oxidoreductase